MARMTSSIFTSTVFNKTRSCPSSSAPQLQQPSDPSREGHQEKAAWRGYALLLVICRHAVIKENKCLLLVHHRLQLVSRDLLYSSERFWDVLLVPAQDLEFFHFLIAASEKSPAKHQRPPAANTITNARISIFFISVTSFPHGFPVITR